MNLFTKSEIADIYKPLGKLSETIPFQREEESINLNST